MKTITENSKSNRYMCIKDILWAIVLIILLFLNFIPEYLMSEFFKTCFLKRFFYYTITSTLFSFALTEMLARTKQRDKHKIRIAFIISQGVLFVTAMMPFILKTPNPMLEQVIINFFFPFIGCYLSSNSHMGFFELNAVPDVSIKISVQERHKIYINNCKSVLIFKQCLDTILSLVLILVSSPVFFLISFIIWICDPGPVIVIKFSTGLYGRTFKQLKFRTMVLDAEKQTGPIMVSEEDSRVLRFGKFLRKTALDELPQLINILKGDMSFVGPRPQRTVLVYEYINEIPAYMLRHNLRPGLAGLAQVCDSYHINFKEKLAWDTYYITNWSVFLDFKILITAFLLTFFIRWKVNHNPELVSRKIIGINKPELN